MSTIMVERELPCSADQAWELLKDVGNVHRAFPASCASQSLALMACAL
jgi:hypothetical protein